MESTILKAAVLVDADGRVSKYNQSSKTIMGESLAEGKPIYDCLRGATVKATMQDAISEAMQGIHQEVNTTMGQYKLTTDVLPRLNDLGEPAGALVLQQKASAVTIDEHGIITEVNEAMCELMGIDASSLIDNDFMDILGEVDQGSTFEAIINVIDHGGTGSCRSDVVVQQEDGLLSSTKCLLDLSTRVVDGQRSIMIILQPEMERPLDQIKKFGSKKKSRQRVSKLSKEDVQLQDAGYWEARAYHKFQVETVKLKQTQIGGALAKGRSLLPTDPMELMLSQIKSGNNEGFTFPQLRVWMQKNPDKGRPSCLQQINAWHAKKMKQVFLEMDKNHDSKVDDDEFSTWWSQNVDHT